MAYDGAAWNEATPTNSTLANEIDDVSVDMKIGVRARMQWEHVWPVSQTGTAEAGYHTYITLSPQTGAPTFPVVASTTQTAAIWASSGSGNVLLRMSGGSSYVFFNSASAGLNVLGGVYSATGTLGEMVIGTTGGTLRLLAPGSSGFVLTASTGGSGVIWASNAGILSSISDYGTSASASTARLNAVLKIAYGQFTFSTNGSQAISGLPFTGATTYNVTIGMGYSETTTENIRVIKDSASQFTLYNDVARTCVVNWIAIGT